MKHKLKRTFDQIHGNCLYAMCVHISAIPRMPAIAYDLTWDNINFSFQSQFSTDGTISFGAEEELLVGALRNNASERIGGYPAKRAIDFFDGAAKEVVELAKNETLAYLLLDFEIKRGLPFGKKETSSLPVITTVFRNEGTSIYSSDRERDFLGNGGEYIEELCAPKDKLAESPVEDYELTNDELAFAERLFDLKNVGQSCVRSDLFSHFIGTASAGYELFVSALSDFGIEILQGKEHPHE